MTQFTGFPAKSNYTSIPNIFFSSLLPQITDINELKVVLHVFETLYPKKGFPKFVTFSDLLNNVSLLKSLGQENCPPEQSLRTALDTAVRRGVLIRVELDNNGKSEDAYFLNSAADRQTAERVQNGEIQLPGLAPVAAPVIPQTEPNIFVLYEENIGMLTPLVADELRDAEKNYPADWLRDAIKEAVNSNRRNWRYISRILERWSTEGKKDGTHQRYSKENTDPDKYIKGKYGHIVQR
jgi:DNA replication protein